MVAQGQQPILGGLGSTDKGFAASLGGINSRELFGASENLGLHETRL